LLKFVPRLRPEKSMSMTNKTAGKNEIYIPGRGRILFMDDDKMIRFLAESMLRAIGYDVSVVCNGEEAILLYQNEKALGAPFDVVILDIKICLGMGGEETIRQLIQIDPEVNAIVSSGCHHDPLMTNFREYGFSGVLPKPYDIRSLHETVAHAIRTPL
jgi:CheY-like chemotaxis protein